MKLLFSVLCEASGNIFIFQDSLTRAKLWVNELLRHGEKDIVIALAGNKSDLQRKISYDEVAAYASQHGFLFMETSAKTSYNTRELFAALGEYIQLERLNSGGKTKYFSQKFIILVDNILRGREYVTSFHSYHR